MSLLSNWWLTSYFLALIHYPQSQRWTSVCTFRSCLSHLPSPQTSCIESYSFISSVVLPFKLCFYVKPFQHCPHDSQLVSSVTSHAPFSHSSLRWRHLWSSLFFAYLEEPTSQLKSLASSSCPQQKVVLLLIQCQIGCCLYLLGHLQLVIGEEDGLTYHCSHLM